MLAFASAVAGDAARGLDARDGARSLQGDRSVEWAFCLARLADGPGTTLDFGADGGFLSLAAAQRGHDVVALDQITRSLDYTDPRVVYRQADVLDGPLEGRTFDQVINCSSVEHVGLAGRYGSRDEPDGDLRAMMILRERMAPDGRMLLTVPVGVDAVFPPLHRVYGRERLPRLLRGYAVEEEEFWVKPAGSHWTPGERESALSMIGSPSFYSLGLFVLRRA